MQEVVQRITGDTQVELYDPIWFSHGRFQHGVASALRKNRVILAGDAGHIPIPISGKGMNTGIQDAFNLGWKLAATLHEQVSSVVLNSYSIERQKIRQQLDTTQVAGFHWIMEPSKIQQHLVRKLGSVWLNLIAARFFKQRLSQLDIAYPDSVLSQDLLGKKGSCAGDRAPDAVVVAIPGQYTITLFKLIYEGLNWTLLLFDGAQGSEILEQLQTIATAIAKEFSTIRVWPVLIAPVLADPKHIPMLLDFDSFAHKAFGLENPALVLIRPDGHVAFRAAINDYQALQMYARQVFKMPPQNNYKSVSQAELTKIQS
uniref:Tjp8 n=1 Tax=Symphyonema bifilamentata 97.28 TaxID=2721247 RepID=A0A6H0DY01_9CYAN|nr:Tjp8 [Symphyonema bifilamentata 97.28]